MNFGAQLGTNISQFNRGIDLGISTSAIKCLSVSNKNDLKIGLGINALKQNLISIGNPVRLSTSDYFFSASGQIEFNKQFNKGGFFGIGLNYSVQSPYNNGEEYRYQVLIGNRISTHWHYAISHLYRPLEAWNLIFTFSRKYTISVYIKEDFNVNNAPDVQTGIDFQIPVLKK